MSDAFDVERLTRTLERAVAHHCPEILAAHREDLVQKAVLRVTGKDSSVDPSRPLSATYLWRVAYCVVIDELRATGRRAETPLEAEGPVGEHPSREPNPEVRAKGREVGRAIEAALERLSPARRAATLLHLQGHSNQEITELLGWNGKQTENLVYRGIRNLRDHLRRKGVEPS